VPKLRGVSPAPSPERVLDDVRSAFRKRSASGHAVRDLLQLHGSIISLSARSKRIVDLLSRRPDAESSELLNLDALSPAVLREFSAFFDELSEFGHCLSQVNFAAIDIYFPGLRDDILEATGMDVNFSYFYQHELIPKYKLKQRELPPTLLQLLDRYSGDWGPENLGGRLLMETAPDTKAKSEFWHGERPTHCREEVRCATRSASPMRRFGQRHRKRELVLLRSTSERVRGSSN